MNSARRALLAVLIVMFAVVGLAAEVDEGPSLEISEWLVLGPLQSTIPAFDDLGAGDALGELLETATLPEIRRLPADGDQIEGFSGPVAWRKIALEGVSIQLEKPTWARDRRVAVAWLSTSIRTKRFVTAGIEVECEHPWKVMLDGKTVEGEAKAVLYAASLDADGKVRCLVLIYAGVNAVDKIRNIFHHDDRFLRSG